MKKSLILAFTFCCLILGFNRANLGQEKGFRKAVSVASESSTRAQDGLNGPVRRVRAESAKIVVKNGKSIEGPRIPRGIATYDPGGRKIDSVDYPVEGNTLPGKERYSYDDKGNIAEMVVSGNDGSILSKEIYQYEFDQLGNWKKMTTAIAVYEEGKLSFEPAEVTYRMITYYYGKEIDKIVASASRASSVSPPSVTPVPALSFSGPQSAPNLAERESKTVKDEKPNPDEGISASPASTESGDDNRVASAPQEGASHPNSHTAVSSGKNSAASFVTPSLASPDQSGLFYSQGLSYLTAGRYTEAVSALRQAVERDPQDALAYTKLGLAYSVLGRNNETVAVLKMAIVINEQVVDAEAYYRLAEAYTALGKHSEALKAFQKAMYITRAQRLESDPIKYAGFPTFPDLHYGLALAYHNVGRYKDAIKELKEATTLKPDFAEAYYGLALAYVALGDRKSASKQEQIVRPLNAALADKIVGALIAGGGSSAGTLRVESETPPPAPAEKPKPQVLRKDIINGEALVLPKPPYPPTAKQLGIRGTVNVQVLVDETGKVISAKAVTGNPALMRAAQQAALNARFSPTKIGEQAVKVSGVIIYNFVLN